MLSSKHHEPVLFADNDLIDNYHSCYDDSMDDIADSTEDDCAYGLRVHVPHHHVSSNPLSRYWLVIVCLCSLLHGLFVVHLSSGLPTLLLLLHLLRCRIRLLRHYKEYDLDCDQHEYDVLHDLAHEVAMVHVHEMFDGLLIYDANRAE